MTGITHYSTPAEGIGGRIKRRITDFKVMEITPKGTACEIMALGDDEKKSIKKEWPENPSEKEYLHLTLEKFNLDMNMAIRKIARWMQVSGKRIGYAGMKDKRAVTSQRISIWKPNMERIGSFNSRYIELRDGEWSDERMELGMLKGNEFEITIRDLDIGEEELQKKIMDFFTEAEKGVANYFGEQRFGGIRKITHLVGKEFLKGDFENGVMIYLARTAEGEEEDVKKARENLGKTRDFSMASKEFPVKYRYERSIIHHLCKYPKDFVGAFGNLPKRLRYMFTHAYQSYLFNEMINKRIAAGIGLEETEGDVLMDGVPTAQLFGFESELSKGKIGEIEKQVLTENEIELGEFRVKKMPELSSKGGRKPIVLKPEGLKLLGIGEDEWNEGKLKATIGFMLSKGNYATTILRELMKND